MVENVRVGGIDPGPRPGLVVLHIADRRVYRVERGPHLMWQRIVACADYVAVEAYVRGRASVRSANAGAQQLTAEIAHAASEAARASGRTWTMLPAGVVKPWATDDRLRAYRVGEDPRHPQAERPTLYELTRGGGGHDRDAARHALRFAVTLGLLDRR